MLIEPTRPPLTPSATLAPLAWPHLTIICIAFAAAELGFGLLGEYGLFIDEFYYLACAERLDWGYVDHPPLAPALLRLVQLVIPDPALALRLPVTLVGCATLFFTGLLTRRFGGDAYAQTLAALALLIAPMPLVMFSFYSMNALEILIWTACAYLLVRIEQDDKPHWWLVFGVLAGLGLQNKHTMVLFAIGLAIGLLTTRARRHLAQRHLWFGLAAAALIFLPNVLWQMAHGWPTLDFYAGASVKNVPTSPLMVLANQILTVNPVNALIWGVGLIALLGSKRLRPYRHLGWLAASLLVLAMIAQQSRTDRLAGIFPFLLAAGASQWQVMTATRRRVAWRWALVALMLASGAALVPIGLPMLEPATMSRYVAAIGIVPQVEAGPGKTGDLPQWWADRFGWRQLAREVDAAIASLPAEDQRRVVVFSPSYGQAGALELYSQHQPPVPMYSAHNSYFLWGPPKEPVTVAIVVGNSAEGLAEMFDQVELVQIHDCRWCIRWRDEMPIWIVRQPKHPIADVWPQLRHFE